MPLGKTTKPFFNHFKRKNTINLLDKVVTEVIQKFGMDMQYLPRRRSANIDDVFTEDSGSSFDTAYTIPIYVKTAQGFMGQEALMSHFGIENRRSLVLTIARMQWETNIIPEEATLYRPYEGDLIYFPLDKVLYEIKFVDEHPYFYQHGHLPMWDLTVEVFEFAGEDFSTGIGSIDCMSRHTSADSYDWAILSEDGLVIELEYGDILTREGFRTHQESVFGLSNGNDSFLEEAGEPEDAEPLIQWGADNPWSEGDW